VNSATGHAERQDDEPAILLVRPYAGERVIHVVSLPELLTTMDHGIPTTLTTRCGTVLDTKSTQVLPDVTGTPCSRCLPP
jgi:hypothetical protein